MSFDPVPNSPPPTPKENKTKPDDEAVSETIKWDTFDIDPKINDKINKLMLQDWKQCCWTEYAALTDDEYLQHEMFVQLRALVHSVMNMSRFKKDPILLMKEWETERGYSEELRFPEDPARCIIKKLMNKEP